MYDLTVFQLWQDATNRLIEVDLAAFDALQCCDCADEFGTASNPEHAVGFYDRGIWFDG